MLRQRLITAALLVPLVVLGVLKLPTFYFSLLLALVLLVGAWEWGGLAGLEGGWSRLAYVLAMGMIFVLGLLYCIHDFPAFYTLMLATIFWWLVVVWRLSRYAGDRLPPGFHVGRALEGVMVLLPTWGALTVLHGMGEWGHEWVLFLLVLIWTADTAAYFTGRAWGRVKLAPKVSPGKTREGVYGALAGALALGLGTGLYRRFEGLDLLWFTGLCVVTAAFSIVGDLFESLAKRQRGVKDSSGLLPGHGGVLDRLDSLTAAAPVFLVGMLAKELL